MRLCSAPPMQLTQSVASARPHLQGPQGWAGRLLLPSVSALLREVFLPFPEHPLLLVAVDVAKQVPDVGDLCNIDIGHELLK